MGDSKKAITAGGAIPSNSPGQHASPSASGSDAAIARACTIRLSYNPDTALVQAQLTPSTDAKPVTEASLRALLAESGYGEFHTSEDILNTVVQKANGRKGGDYVVAERRDGKLALSISDDRQAVYLTLHRAWGGTAVSRESVVSELTALGVDERCVLPEAIGQALSLGETARVLIARAIMPEQGTDTRFEPLFDSGQPIRLVEDEKGRVDMHQLHEFVVVPAGTPVMRRIPATAGEDGINVLGEVLDAKHGQELPYAKDCPGVEADPKNPNILRAAIKGHPVIIKQGIRVDPVLRVKNVDLTTGNIDFDGSIEVAGDVTSGFVVNATGDIVVRGMVEKAIVSAGKDLIISGGVVGEDQGQDGQGRLRLRTHLRAGQNVSAKFINLADVSAAMDITVREYALQSHLNAGRDILLGQPTGKGILIGGSARANRAVVANVLGSEANVAGEVTVGYAPRRRQLLGALRREIELAEHNWKKLGDLVDEMARGLRPKAAPAKLERIMLTQEALELRRDRLIALVERVSSRMQASTDSRVVVKRQLFANVSVSIDGVCHTYHRDQGPGYLLRAGAELVNRLGM